MLKEDKDRIIVKLEEMGNYMDELKEILPNQDEYVKDLVKKRACEKTIELAIESMVDVCAMIISYQKLGVPSDEDNIFDILVKKKVISAKMSEKLKEIKGFRNIIIHRYGDVDDSLAYESLSSELKDFDQFEKVIKKYLKKV